MTTIITDTTQTPAVPETKLRTITLSGRAPVRIDEARWPIIAQAEERVHDGTEYESQAGRVTSVQFYVRRHEDGRAIVYAVFDHMTRWADERSYTHRAGYLAQPVDGPIDLATMIKYTASDLVERHCMATLVQDAMNKCIAALPPEELS